ncbi:energy transducer TonB [Alkalimarinus alittae]|uniref:Energy transducer TonB n=1 Tax=Alkalimarinus alittae TaxID=2961619 RepID=A0ABY6MXK8_9ALTE|nr:energy transducer TonB [Alkalimarinus alittae]UZE94565.1 energy transducer TonB [Alkalimarinus alittae]
MTIKATHWAITLVIAISLHALIFIVMPSDSLKSAAAEGKQGVEIDLGMMGDFGDTIETSDAVNDMVKPVTEVLEENVTESIVEEVVEEPEIQQTEILVDRSDAKQNVDARIVDIKTKSTVKENVKEDRLEPVNKIEITEAENTEHDNFQVEAPKENQLITQKKKSTGDANSLSTGGDAGVSRSYLAKLLAQLAQHKRYPLSSRRKAEEGIAILDFKISRTGRVLDFDIQKSSGFDALDKAVLVMLKRAEPFPPVPADIKGNNIRFTLPIAFKLNS